jgi:hypothetical protein
MSNFEFIVILLKAFWPLTLLAGIGLSLLLIDFIMMIRNRKVKKYVAIHNR